MTKALAILISRDMRKEVSPPCVMHALFQLIVVIAHPTLGRHMHTRTPAYRTVLILFNICDFSENVVAGGGSHLRTGTLAFCGQTHASKLQRIVFVHWNRTQGRVLT